MTARLGRAMAALALAATASAAPALNNVLFIIVDNLRPALGAYGDPLAVTPEMDELALNSTLFANVNTQFAWCAPSRNSFLSGRRPAITESYNFLDSFREVGPNWTSLPGAFRAAGFYTTSLGKVFHPGLPPDNDAAQSWSDTPFAPSKPDCPGWTMACAATPGTFDVDEESTNELLARLAARPAGRPFFAALGLQAPRLPWVFSPAQAARLPPAAAFPLPARATAEGLDPLEYFRPTEIDEYTDVRNVTHAAPMPPNGTRALRCAYYATVSGVDAQVGRALAFLDVDVAGLADSTVVALVADHGQALGERNLWSMMSTLDTATRVPMLLRAAPRQAQRSVYPHPVELVDLMPTLAALAGLPPLPPAWGLPGVDLSAALQPGGGRVPGKDAAFSQITRCFNCSLAYGGGLEAAQCQWDEAADALFAVPCAKAPRTEFDLMGFSVRTDDWRYTLWCKWNGTALGPELRTCGHAELFDHRGEVGTQPLFRPDAEARSVAGDPALAPVEAVLRAKLAAQFSVPH